VKVPYLRVANVQAGYLDLSEIKEIEIERAQLERFSLRSGDVLMNEGGDFDKLGRGTVWRGQITPCAHQNHVFAVRPRPAVESEWIAILTQSDYMKFYFMGRAKQSTNLASISSTSIGDAPIVVPPPNERKNILAKISSATAYYERLVLRVEESVALLRERRQSLITAAVTGQLDPSVYTQQEARA
jgi:type I restriction enzyme S subunit